MIELRPLDSHGRTRDERIDAVHHLAFSAFQDLRRIDWGDLVTLNHNILPPRGEVRAQPIDGVESLAIVRSGVIAHSGIFGPRCRAVAGEVMLVSPGRGMEHGYFNPGARPADYVELRIRADALPDRPMHRTTRFPTRARIDEAVVIASSWPEDRSALRLHGAARVHAARIRRGSEIPLRFDPGAMAYAVVLAGRVRVGDLTLGAGDGCAMRHERALTLYALDAAHVLVVETVSL
jgi:redox-sensitive bicupin YhaK (pirin superfamily)